jgi:hypothetical protein
MLDNREGEGSPASQRLGWKAGVAIVALHAAGLAVATYPTVLTLGSTLPGGMDSLQHLWVMRWYKTCLLEGRPIFVCPELQYPTGAPLGNFSALQLQALLYLPVSLVSENDVLCYNIIWIFGLLLAGFGTAVLGWFVLRDRACAAFGGLLSMLSAPLLFHAMGHLELIYIGTFPLFLVAWMRFVDRPDRARLLTAVLGYLVVAMSAAYFMVFAIFPAALYVAWQAARNGRRDAWRWLRNRASWLAGFAALCLPCLLVLFSSQMWVVLHGDSLAWPREEFERYGAPLWGYALPTQAHSLGKLLPRNPSAVLADWWERSSYLGVVTLGLVAYAAIARVRFARSGYVWGTLLLCVVLSLGASWQLGTREVSLPSAWLYRCFPLYRATRVPGRFNLLAGVIAGTLAAAGLAHLLARFSRAWWRVFVFAGLAACAVADLSLIPFWRGTLPQMPACYGYLNQRHPNATILEIPYVGSGGSNLNAICTYWQALHGLSTSAGYSGHVNVHQDQSVGYNSPFLAPRLAEPDYLRDTDKVNFGYSVHVDFLDYVWLYLTANHFDYIVLHRWPGAMPEYPVRLDRIEELLRDGKIYADADTIVYDRSLLKPPAHPVHVNLGEWRGRGLWQGRWNSVIPKTARIAVYSPDSAQELSLVIDMAPLHKPRVVRIQAGSQELARWQLFPGQYRHCVSPPFRLPAGLHELTIESRSSGPPPVGLAPESIENGPYSLRVSRVSLYTNPATESIAVQDRDRPDPSAAATTTR